MVVYSLASQKVKMAVKQSNGPVEDADKELVAEKGTELWAGFIADAREASDLEHKYTFREALRLYRRTVFWSIIVSLSIVMCGYDFTVILNIYAQPAFQKFTVSITGNWLSNSSSMASGNWAIK